MTTLNPAARWVDGKRYLWLLSPLVPPLVMGSLWTYMATGQGGWLWGAWILIYAIIPALDLIVGTDKTNPPEEAAPGLEADRYYRIIVAAYVPAQFAVTAWGAWIAATHSLAWWEYIGLVISIGVVNGVGINTAHELGHKNVPWERWLARLTLAPVAYGHFFVEHNRGHHIRVATPEDPASSRLGESFWAFLPRTMVGSVRSAWALETERLAKGGHGPWTWRNEVLQAWALTVVFYAALTAWLGPVVLPFLLLQAFYGASLLEVVNYIEHYGLLRQKDPRTGRYERCKPEHSWNSNHIVTNLFLYQLQRHSDHHAHAMRRFQALRHFEESPQLPSGYASMLLAAYVPPVWYALMDRRVLAHYGGDVSRANLQPSRRKALLARYAAQGPGNENF